MDKKRNIPLWLYCKEQWINQPIPLYQQSWLKACEDGLLQDINFLYHRTCFPKFEVEYTTSFCIERNCSLVCEPHIHITDNHNSIFYDKILSEHWDRVWIPTYPELSTPKNSE